MRRPVYGRKIQGISAVLLPMECARPSLERLQSLLCSTVDAGLTPAVNMDTGYANFLSPQERLAVLSTTSSALEGKEFVAGAHAQGAEDPEGSYTADIDAIVRHGGIPVLFPSTWLSSLEPSAKLKAIRRFAHQAGRLIVFELGKAFVPFGEIWSLDFYAELMQIPEVVGAKHSSLQREPEWCRLELRDQIRPDFHVYTGNDLAIDMVMWGSDYLLGLSAFHPSAFSLRDRWWESGDDRFFELNDALQALGAFAFRYPVPAYKHSCAQYLKIRGKLEDSSPHPLALIRPDADVEILAGIHDRVLEAMGR